MFVVLATIVFGILFMFCGYLLIYNVFEIAVTNDIRQYGLLRTVGTTSNRSSASYPACIVPIPDRNTSGAAWRTSGWAGVFPAAIEVFAFHYGARNIEVGSLPYLAIVIISILFWHYCVY